MRTHVSLLLALTLSANALGEDCPPAPRHEQITSLNSKPLAPARFEEITRGMTTWEIVQRLGPAVREYGSGLTILEWRSTDGRKFIVGGGSLCAPPIYFHFAPA